MLVQYAFGGVHLQLPDEATTSISTHRSRHLAQGKGVHGALVSRQCRQ